jgi:hypothetical protein
MTTSNSVVAKALSRIVADYFTTSGGERRLAAPGLTKRVAQQVHENLLSQGLNSYLIVNDVPDEAKKHILSDGLTSVRQGSFVAITYPGQLAKLQEGVRGIGGVLRTTTFGEEFPFEPGEGEFSFDKVLDHILLAWLPNPQEEGYRSWIKRIIIDGLIPACRSIPAVERARYLFLDILDAFEPSLHSTELPDIRERFLLHCGIPGRIDGNEDAGDFLEVVGKLCRKIAERLLQIGSRELARENATDDPELDDQTLGRAEKDQLKEKLLGCVDTFLDAFSLTAIDGRHAGEILSLCRAWTQFVSDPTQKLELWETLHRDRLQRFFEVQANVPSSLQIDKLDPGNDGITLNKQIVAFKNETIQVDFTFDTKRDPAAFSAENWQVGIFYRGTEVITPWTCDNPRGTHNLTFEGADINSPNFKLCFPLKLRLLRDGNEEASCGFHTIFCGPERPGLVVLEGSSLDVFDLSDNPDLDQGTVESIQGALSLSILLEQAATNPPVVKLDYKSRDLKETTLPSRTFKDSRKIGPAQLNVPRSLLEISQDNLSSSISLSAQEDRTECEFTIENELRSLIAQAKIKNRDLKNLLNLFDGVSTTPWALGGLDSGNRNLSRLADLMSGQNGWKPVIADLESIDFETEKTALLNYLGRNVRRFANIGEELSPDLVELHATYVESRWECIKFLNDHFEELDTHPLYAYAPVFIRPKEDEVSDLIQKYLEAYEAILAKLKEKFESDSLTRTDALIMSSMDRVVHRSASQNTVGNFFLMGPWHPMVLCKRFLSQRMLFLAGKRYTTTKPRYAFHVLGSLLAGLTGFSNGTCLSQDRIEFDPALISAAEDPGWLMGTSSEFLNFPGFTAFLSRLNDNLGLCFSLTSEGQDKLGSNFFTRFSMAFPEKRRAALHFMEGYSLAALMEIASEVLVAKDQPTDFSYKMPGGLHFILEEKPVETEELACPEEVFIYHGNSIDEILQEQLPDVKIESGKNDVKLEANPSSNFDVSLQRGQKNGVILTAAPQSILEGDDTKRSAMYLGEQDPGSGNSDLGTTFKSIAFKLGELSSMQVQVKKESRLPLGDLPTQWLYLPSSIVDPAVLVDYVEDGEAEDADGRSLWDYKHDVTHQGYESYFILSRVPPRLDAALSECLDKPDLAKGIVTDLGKRGIAVGGDAAKTTNNAKGAVGLAGAVRLFCGWGEDNEEIFLNGNESIGFLLPVDSFETILGNKVEDPESVQQKLSDLFAIQLILPPDDDHDMVIRALSVEAKYRKQNCTDQQVRIWFQQAKDTYERFKELVGIAKKDDGIPERLGLLELLQFGVRLSYQHGTDWLKKEATFLSAMLQGRFRLKEESINTVLITTEREKDGTAESTDQLGRWIRLNPGNWPGVSDTQELLHVRDKLKELILADEGEANSQDMGDPEDPSVEGLLLDDDEEEEEISPSGSEAPDEDIQAPPDVGTSGIGSSFQAEQGDETEPPAEVEEVSETEPQPVSQPLTELSPFLIGMSEGEPVYLDFDGQFEQNDRLPNRNFMVTGSSGKGKTALLKTAIGSLREQSANMLLIDVKSNDFAGDDSLVQKCGFNVSYCRHEGLPYNPLYPSPIINPRTGESYFEIRQHVQKITSVLASTYGLQVQQDNTLQEAILQCYSQNGINPDVRNSAFDSNCLPVLDDVEEKLRTMGTPGQTALGRLRSLFTYRVFGIQSRTKPFEEFISESWIMALSDFEDDAIKNAISKLIIVNGQMHFNSLDPTGGLRLGVLFDEAHRVSGLQELESLARQARSYGVALILASQNEDDFTHELSDCFETKIAYGEEKFKVKLKNSHYNNLETLISTISWPHYLLYRHIKDSGPITVSHVDQIEGYNSGQLSVDELLKHMREMELIEVINDEIHLRTHVT